MGIDVGRAPIWRARITDGSDLEVGGVESEVIVGLRTGWGVVRACSW